jgi:uncharacterized protein YbcI
MTVLSAIRDRFSGPRSSASVGSRSAAQAEGARFPNLSAELSKSLGSLWTRYAGKRPIHVRTEVRGNVVTCQLIDAVGDFNKTMIAPQTGDTVRGFGKPTLAEYKRDAVAVVVGLTRQRVMSFISSHDRDTDVATEVFTLEPSLGKGRPRLHASGSF